MQAENAKQQDPLLLACSLIPAVGLAAFYSFVIRARVALGAWPTPYRSDPKDLGFDVHYIASWLLLDAALVSPAALAFCLLVHQATSLKHRSAGWPLAVFFFSYLAFCGLFAADPGSFLEWFAD